MNISYTSTSWMNIRNGTKKHIHNRISKPKVIFFYHCQTKLFVERKNIIQNNTKNFSTPKNHPSVDYTQKQANRI